jgi:XTP/dITP diphosphohydrolase
VVHKLLVATRNAGKLRELRAMLEGLAVEVVAAAECGLVYEAEETGRTFAENAVIKAEALSRAGGLPAVADDSGLEVDALGGLPGVRSARFGADEAASNARLLRMLDGIPDERRTARFVSVVALAVPGRPIVLAEGICRGVIARSPRGNGGFGYDPLFVCRDGDAGEANGLTFAEMPDELKNRVSHRARAMRRLREIIAGQG